MGNSFSSFLSSLFDLVAPPRASERVLRRLTLEQLSALQTNSPAGEGLPYHDPRVTALVWELKYHASPRAAALAGALLAEELLAIASEELGTPLLIPVPMHPERRRERGYNQTELLCKVALKALRGTASEKVLGSPVRAPTRRGRPDFFSSSSAPLQYEPNLLVRTRFTLPQQGLPKHLRLQNIRDSMEVKNSERVRGRVCIVVDDVSTTGATFAEARHALTAAGAARVECLALAWS